MSEKKYRCIKSFSVPDFTQPNYEDREDILIPIGEIFLSVDIDKNYKCDNDIMLLNDNTGYWLHMNDILFEHYFEEVK